MIFEETFLATVPAEICQVGLFQDLLPSVKGLVFPESEEQLISRAEVPDPNCWRFLGRSGCLTMLHYPALRKILEDRKVSGERVGLYGCMRAGAIDFNAVFELAKIGFENFAPVMRKKLPPKQMFKTSPNIPLAQMGIFLKLTGPTITFHERDSAIAQGRLALSEGDIDLAIGLTGCGLEDPLQNAFESKHGEMLRESTTCVVFGRDQL